MLVLKDSDMGKGYVNCMGTAWHVTVMVNTTGILF